jgi:hypothetical protein
VFLFEIKSGFQLPPICFRFFLPPCVRCDFPGLLRLPAGEAGCVFEPPVQRLEFFLF